MISIIIDKYLIVGIALSTMFIIINILSDISQIMILNEEPITFDMLISDISEGLIIGLAWGISVPIICLTNIIIASKDIIVELFNKGEKE